MHPGINNFSEIGKPNKVLLHRIGHEVEGLVPDNFARLLFDDIPFLAQAQKEHDAFAKLLRDNGVEVVVAGVGVQRHVGHHAQLREACLE